MTKPMKPRTIPTIAPTDSPYVSVLDADEGAKGLVVAVTIYAAPM
jgi:hypothetical protein